MRDAAVPVLDAPEVSTGCCAPRLRGASSRALELDESPVTIHGQIPARTTSQGRNLTASRRRRQAASDPG
jgi:hypothetical protein